MSTVLSRLANVLKRRKLVAAARLCPMVWVQRLGYLLELVGREDLTPRLAAYVERNSAALAPLVRAKPLDGVPRNERWRLAINASLRPL